MDELPTIDDGSVVVGVDDSEHARKALRWAVEEGAARGVPVHVISVWQYPLKGVPTTTDPDAPPVDPDALVLERLDAMVAETLGEHASDVRTATAFGYPGKVLAELGEKASMVVVGPRGRSGLAALTLGSTADHLVKHATCPVVVVR